jgi:hypothetical protein
MNEQKNETRKGSRGPLDFRLVLARLEKEIIGGEDPARCRTILGRGDVWKKLDAEMQLKWARLAQMAGEVEIALGIFTHINHTDPDRTDAWFEHLELLSLLDKRTDLARVLAASRGHIGEERRREWFRLSKGENRGEDGDVDETVEPFERLRQRQKAIERFLDLFSAVGEQTRGEAGLRPGTPPDGRTRRGRTSLREEDIRHLPPAVRFKREDGGCRCGS